MSSVVAEGKTLHVIVGHSLFLDTKTRLRRVYVADPSILNSVTLSPNQIVVTALAPGVSSLTLLDESGQAQPYVVSADVDVEGLRVAMSQAMRSNAVSVDGNGGHVVLSGIVGSDAMADTAVKLAGLYSKEVANALTVIPTHPKQVRLQVRILEVDRSKALQLGINLFNPGGNTSFLAGTTTSQFPSTMAYSASGSGNVGTGQLTFTNPLNFMLYSAKLNLGATIQDLESKQVLQILAEPTITTVSGETANFLSGGEFPFPVIQPGAAGAGPIVTIMFRPYGVKVDFTPIVNEDGTIRLKVAPEVSALDYTNTVTISGFTIPAISTRRATTEVELRSDQSFAISGLLDQRTTDILSKNPGAASIPILGYLFKSKNVNHSTTELVVVVTPTVVDPLSDANVPAQPELPIPTLNTDSYDKSLGKDANPRPAAPPLNPNHPPFGGSQIPPALPSAAPSMAPAVGAAEEVAPPLAAPSAPAVLPSPVVATAVVAAESTYMPAQVPSGIPFTAPTRIAAPTQLQVPMPQATPEPATVAAALAAAAREAPAIQPSASSGASPNTGDHAAGAGDAPARAMVEIMTLSHEADADAMVAALRRHGYSVAINRDPHDSLLHLDVGPFASKADAETMRQRLLGDGYDATIK
jgi:pilus assembly protein CpaC